MFIRSAKIRRRKLKIYDLIPSGCCCLLKKIRIIISNNWLLNFLNWTGIITVYDGLLNQSGSAL